MATRMSSAQSPSAADQAAVAAVPQSIVKAWAEHDATAFADAFIENGTLVLPGVFLTSRQEIGSFMAAAYESDLKGTRVTGSPVNVRFLSDTVCVLITEGGVLAPGETEPAKERAIRASWLLNKQDDGRWLLAAYQNTPRNPR